MGDLKSLRLLWTHLARNQRYQPFLTESDIRTFEERLTDEGLAFLTSGLPLIGKALDRFHSTHEWAPPEGFSTREVIIQQNEDARIKLFGPINVPIFMGNAVERALSGSPSAVDCVRQMSYVFYKLEVSHEESVRAKFLDQFKATDHGLSSYPRLGDRYSDLLIAVMKGLISRILCNADPLDIVPSHGSGATACRTANWDKYHKLRYFPKLDNVYPYSDFFFFNYTHLSDEMGLLEKAEVASPMARVCLVPKDSRGPRIISCEPAELMFIQQGIMRKLYEVIESHPITRGQINFSDQTINRQLAEAASKDNALATIDLSDASDRVSLELVRRVFPENWFEALEACRSEHTQLPNGEIVKLNKFAPMGSSCCFPVEALVFWACAQAALRIHYGKNNHSVHVYGDDIITPSTYAEDVIHGLETVGLLVNRDKCFVDGPFRESCGGDYYLGNDVTPVRYRKNLGLSGTLLESTADFLNNLIKKFGEAGIQDTIREIESGLGYVFPRTLLDLPGTIRVTAGASNDVFFKRRWNSDFQRFEHRILRSTSKVIQRRDPNWAELFRKQLSVRIVKQPDRYVNQVAILDRNTLPGQYTDPHSFSTKWVWCWLG